MVAMATLLLWKKLTLLRTRLIKLAVYILTVAIEGRGMGGGVMERSGLEEKEAQICTTLVGL